MLSEKARKTFVGRLKTHRALSHGGKAYWDTRVDSGSGTDRSPRKADRASRPVSRLTGNHYSDSDGRERASLIFYYFACFGATGGTPVGAAAAPPTPAFSSPAASP